MENKSCSGTVLRGDVIIVVNDEGSLLNLDIPVGTLGKVVCVIDKFNIEVKFNKYSIPLRMTTDEVEVF